MSEYNEKRQQFRVDLVQTVSTTARIFSVADKPIDEGKEFPVTIMDLSPGGMRAFIPMDLPVKVLVINTIFEFEKEMFCFSAQILRKVRMKDGFEYGLKFIYFTRDDEDRLTRSLNQYKLKNTRFKKIELDLRKQQYVGCFVRVLELVQEPACLVTNHRIVVAMNKAAEEIGVTLGDRCYITLNKQVQPCPHCRLDEAPQTDGIVAAEALFRGKPCMARWLYMEDNISIHYYS